MVRTVGEMSLQCIISRVYTSEASCLQFLFFFYSDSTVVVEIDWLKVFFFFLLFLVFLIIYLFTLAFSLYLIYSVRVAEILKGIKRKNGQAETTHI